MLSNRHNTTLLLFLASALVSALLPCTAKACPPASERDGLVSLGWPTAPESALELDHAIWMYTSEIRYQVQFRLEDSQGEELAIDLAREELYGVQGNLYRIQPAEALRPMDSYTLRWTRSGQADYPPAGGELPDFIELRARATRDSAAPTLGTPRFFVQERRYTGGECAALQAPRTLRILAPSLVDSPLQLFTIELLTQDGQPWPSMDPTAMVPSSVEVGRRPLAEQREQPYAWSRGLASAQIPCLRIKAVDLRGRAASSAIQCQPEGIFPPGVEPEGPPRSWAEQAEPWGEESSCACAQIAERDQNARPMLFFLLAVVLARAARREGPLRA